MSQIGRLLPDWSRGSPSIVQPDRSGHPLPDQTYLSCLPFALGACGQPRRASSVALPSSFCVAPGEWHFGYGSKADEAQTSVLTQGAFYTEPADAPHFAFTDDQPATVFITGTG